jgi:COP9 signalosome complex subunit 4
MEKRVDDAINSFDYEELKSIFSGSTSDKRILAAHFVKSVLASPSFLTKGLLLESNNELMEVIKTCLGNLPSSESILNGADNTLRVKLFDLLVERSEYREAASFLSTIRIEPAEHSPYHLSPVEVTDVFVKIAECFLHEEDYVEADIFVTKAGPSVEAITNPEEHTALILRYKSTQARVFDAHRKFLDASHRYYDLSLVGNQTDIVDADDLLEFLGRATTCAILAPSGPQRNRILESVHNDQRLSQLESIPHFSTHASILTKMYNAQVIRRDEALMKFEDSLAPHQKALMGDGLTIVQRALLEHNMVAVSKIYKTIYFESLSQLLGLGMDKVEKMAAKMILDGSLHGTIDEVDGILTFGVEEEPLVAWDGAITSFCMNLNSAVDAVRHDASYASL